MGSLHGSCNEQGVRAEGDMFVLGVPRLLLDEGNSGHDVELR